MSTIGLTNGEQYTIGKIAGSAVILDGTDDKHAEKIIRNNVEIITTADNGTLGNLHVNSNHTSITSPVASFDNNSHDGLGNGDDCLIKMIAFNASWIYGIDNSDGNSFKFDTAGNFTDSGGSAELKISTTGDVSAKGDVIAYAGSDIRMKDNIIDISNPLNKIKQIRGVEFDWNEKGPSWTRDQQFGNPSGSLHDVGVIAQEIQKVLPEAVVKRENSKMLAVDYKKIVPLLIEGIKEQQTMIDDLQEQINRLINK